MNAARTIGTSMEMYILCHVKVIRGLGSLVQGLALERLKTIEIACSPFLVPIFEVNLLMCNMVLKMYLYHSDLLLWTCTSTESSTACS